MARLLLQAVSQLLLAAGSAGVLLNLERSPQVAAAPLHRGVDGALAEPGRALHALGTEDNQYANLSADDFESMMAPSAAVTIGEPPSSECEDAVEGDSCHHAVMWLLMGGFERHPGWYPSYSAESSFRDVQALLHGLGKGRCERPCGLAPTPAGPPAGLPAGGRRAPRAGERGCHDAVEGERCFQSLTWLKARGLALHPAWYPGLRPESTAGEVQAALHRLGKAQCAEPCAPQERPARGAESGSGQRGSAPGAGSASGAPAGPREGPAPEGALVAAPSPGEECGDAQPLSECFLAVKFAMAEGIRTLPDAFPGLRPGATFRQVQESLHLAGRHACQVPCPLPDVRKSLGQMSGDELMRYLSGEWDGMVKASEAEAGASLEGTGASAAAAAEEAPWGSAEAAPVATAEAAPAAAAEVDASLEGASDAAAAAEAAPAAAAEVGASLEDAGDNAAAAAEEAHWGAAEAGASREAANDSAAAVEAAPAAAAEAAPAAAAEAGASREGAGEAASAAEAAPAAAAEAGTSREGAGDNAAAAAEAGASREGAGDNAETFAAAAADAGASLEGAGGSAVEGAAAVEAAPASLEGGGANTSTAAEEAAAAHAGGQAPDAAPAGSAMSAGAGITEGAQASPLTAFGEASGTPPGASAGGAGAPARGLLLGTHGGGGPLPYVDDDGVERAAEEVVRAGMEEEKREIRRDLRARLAERLAAGRGQAQGSPGAASGTEEVTGRLSQQVIAELGTEQHQHE